MMTMMIAITNNNNIVSGDAYTMYMCYIYSRKLLFELY